jgi:hypothetical protein
MPQTYGSIDAYGLLYYCIQHRSANIIQQKTRSHHATTTHLAISENHANRALCPENAETPHQLGARNIAYPRHPPREGALIQSSRLLASVAW